MSRVTRLRLHHLLCSMSYKGKGYGKKFVSAADRLMNRLKNTPDIMVRITTGKDALCSNCPGTCKKAKVSIRDKFVIKLLGLKNGEVYVYSELVKKLHRLMTPEKHAEICKECQWWELCKDAFKKAFEDAA